MTPAAGLVDRTTRPGDAVLFVPAGTRVGIGVYARSGEHRAVDVALRPDGSPLRADQIAGLEVPAANIAGLLDGHPDVYLVGDPLPVASGPHVSASDRAKVNALLQAYAVVWSRPFGVISVTLLSRRPAP